MVENTLNFISRLKILVKNDRKLIFELRCNNKLIMYNNFYNYLCCNLVEKYC